MTERRRLERYSLRTTATVEADLESGRGEPRTLVTRDVSSAGAFVVTSQPLTEGRTVRLELLLPVETLCRILGETSNVIVKVRGKVVRTDDRGMAIAFDGRHVIALAENTRDR